MHFSDYAGDGGPGGLCRDDVKFGVPINQIPKARRGVFTADPGFVILGADYSAAESHIYSYVSGDERYIEAHEGPLDTHSFVGKLSYPELAWPDDPKEVKEFATKYKEKGWKKALRDLMKIVQHGSNLVGSPYALAVNSGLPVKVMEEAQDRYFTAFPGLKGFQQWVRKELKAKKRIVMPGFGFEREFFERPWSEQTWKEAVAFIPQGFLALYTHKAMMDIWEELEGPECNFMIHNHDQLVYQILNDPPSNVTAYKVLIREKMEWPIEVTDYQGKTRTLTLKTDMKIGPNWKKVC